MNNYIYDISIVMAYHNRKNQIINTLDIFEKQYANKYNFEVIIIDDNSDKKNILKNDIKKYSFPIKLININASEKGDRTNPCKAYNRGFQEANGKIIIIQNPECYHVGDILGYTLSNLKEDTYFSYSCYSANNQKITDQLLQSDNPYSLIINDTFDKKNNDIIDLSWYNHPIKNKTYYHFCSAIYKSKLDLIGGFDESFSDGYCFDDDELVLAIKHNLKLNIKIIDPKDGFVIHQFHGRGKSFRIDKESDNNPIKIKWLRNKKLYEDIKNYHESKGFHFPKILHLYWDGSPFSYLNLITVLSFNKYNKFWKINVYTPSKRTEGMSWKSHEQKMRYSGKCYFNKLYDIPNVFIHKIDLDQIGFKNDASEVIKSDYFRYHILQKHGGVWSDFDVVYTESIEDKMNFVNKDTVIAKCISFQDPKNKQNSTIYKYFPIAFLMCKPNNKFFAYISQMCNTYYNPNAYQSIGASMWEDLFRPNGEDPYIFDDNIQVCDQEYYMPYAYNELYELFLKTENTLPKNNIAIHWFNGSPVSKEYVNKLDNRLDSFVPEYFFDKIINEYINKISIVMTYYNRKNQLINTLSSIEKSNYKNIEIIIVDDNSNKDQKLETFIDKFKHLDIKTISIDKNKKKWINPCVPYNLGIKKAQGNIIILQNAEILHVFDCIDFVAKNLKRKDWLTLNCYGSPNIEYNNKILSINDLHKFYAINDEDLSVGGNSVINDEVGGWLNHYSLHFVAYHYFGAIYKDDLLNIMNGGFDESFKDGIACDDDEFVKRLLYNNFNFTINKFEQGQPFVIHQYHDKPEILKLYQTKNNVKKFRSKCIKMGFVPENNIYLAPTNETPISKQKLITSKTLESKSIKYSILLPYYKRYDQLKQTLKSYLHHYSRTDFEILIGEDYKNFLENDEHEKLMSIIDQYSKILNIKLIPTHFPNTYNPCVSLNNSASFASGEFLIISNPECFHETNILKGFDEEINKNGSNIYIVCSCLAIQELNIKPTKLTYYIDETKRNYHDGWLQHSIYNNRMFHFCTCISKTNYHLLGGFDENFKHGVGWDDLDFINRIKQTDLKIILRDDLKVLHQKHNKDYQNSTLININTEYYKKKWN